jgi:L-amino acid N-acyltransferase YncA
MTGKIRLARESDASAVVGIYGPFCEDSPISFETTIPSVSEVERRIRTVSEHYPWFVCESQGKIFGYAYAGRHRDRAAYRWSVDVAVYLSEDSRGQGVGTALYTALFAVLRIQGFFNAYAGITLPNPASVRLHKRFGFESVGIYRAAGYKAGGWHDVSWWALALRPPEDPPEEPILMQDTTERADFLAAIDSAEYLLRS